MSERERGFIYRNCISRCRFKAKNCVLKDDGKSDCSTKLENCIYLCEIDDSRKMLKGRQPQPREMARAAIALQSPLLIAFTISASNLDSHLAQIENSQSKNDGIDFGQSVAQAIMMLRSTDGAMEAMHVPCPDGTQPGEWRRTASGEPMAPGWGEVTPWAMTTGSQFNQGGPPPLTSQEYAAAYSEVHVFGAKNSPDRTAEQTHLAMFWNPHVPAKWNSLARDIAQREELSLTESAR